MNVNSSLLEFSFTHTNTLNNTYFWNVFTHFILLSLLLYYDWVCVFGIVFGVSCAAIPLTLCSPYVFCVSLSLPQIFDPVLKAKLSGKEKGKRPHNTATQPIEANQTSLFGWLWLGSSIHHIWERNVSDKKTLWWDGPNTKWPKFFCWFFFCCGEDESMSECFGGNDDEIILRGRFGSGEKLFEWIKCLKLFKMFLDYLIFCLLFLLNYSVCSS